MNWLQQLLRVQGSAPKSPELLIFGLSSSSLDRQKKKYTGLGYHVTAVLVTQEETRQNLSCPDVQGRLGFVDPVRALAEISQRKNAAGLQSVDVMVSSIDQIKNLMRQLDPRPQALLTYNTSETGSGLPCGFEIIQAVRSVAGVTDRIPAVLESRALNEQGGLPGQGAHYSHAGSGRYWVAPRGGNHADAYFKQEFAAAKQSSPT